MTVTANNQITGDTYDAAGNLMTVPGTGGATYVYNAENQMTSTSNSSTAYVYDGDGNRVEKTGSKIYWYAGGEILDETDTTGSTTNSSFNEYYFFGGMRVARRDSSSNVFYYLADNLDSSRVIAEVPSGQTTPTMCYDADFEPYGGEHAYLNSCPQNYKFTSKERDTESGLDNFGARYYASTTGRFMSPDWALRPTAVPYATFGDPQSLNLYTYVENSPLNRIDADGHCSDVREGECDGSAGPGGTVATQTAQNNASQTQSQQNQQQAQGQARPAGLEAVSVEIMDTGNDYGIKLKVTYQILDQTGKPMTGDGAKMEPQEHVTAQVNGQAVQGLPNGYADIGPSRIKGTSKYADAKGQFTDAPLGIAGPRDELGGSLRSLSNQEIRIKIGKETFAVRYNRIVIVSDSPGHGTFSNQYGWIGGDLNASH